MAMAPEQTPSSTPGDFGEKVSISQLILSRLDDIRHDQDIMRQDIRDLDAKFDKKIFDLDTKLDKKISDLDAKFDQKFSALAYWYGGTLVVIIIGFLTLILRHA
ncbi:MAG: hypothetical protein C7B44_15345 [Sulfobacillus thermosulfidooxidans]|nr:MAG: hypothetical protein C7B44_15345 [Sulfobacillus thermosulfidooxidans]